MSQRFEAASPDDYRLIDVSVSRTRQIVVPKNWSEGFARQVAERTLLNDIEAYPFDNADVASRELPMRPFDDDMDADQVLVTR